MIEEFKEFSVKIEENRHGDGTITISVSHFGNNQWTTIAVNNMDDLNKQATDEK